MANIHGKRTVVKLNGTALTAYSENSTVDIEADEHDLTTYGKNSHVFGGGLLKSSFTVSGFYDSTASTGPRALPPAPLSLRRSASGACPGTS
jgi:hypothetical protein